MEKKNYRQILLDGVKQAGIPENMIFDYNHKVTIDNNSIVFTWGIHGIYHHKSYTDVKIVSSAEEVKQIILENRNKR